MDRRKTPGLRGFWGLGGRGLDIFALRGDELVMIPADEETDPSRDVSAGHPRAVGGAPQTVPFEVAAVGQDGKLGDGPVGCSLGPVFGFHLRDTGPAFPVPGPAGRQECRAAEVAESGPGAVVTDVR